MKYKNQHRHGVAAVEFALTVPFLFLFIFATYELGRANMIMHTTEAAAYEGARDDQRNILDIAADSPSLPKPSMPRWTGLPDERGSETGIATTNLQFVSRGIHVPWFFRAIGEIAAPEWASMMARRSSGRPS